MAKRADVELRIRSKSVATKDIAELNAELDKFVDTQKRQADSAALATRSLKDLNTEQRELAKIASELAKRQSMVESLIGKQAELSAAKNNINQIRVKLAELLSIKSKGTFLGDIDKAIKTVKTELTTAEKVFDRTAAGVEKLDAALRAVGVDTTDTATALNRVTESLNRAQAAVVDQTADINRYAVVSDNAAAATRRMADAAKAQQAAFSSSGTWGQQRAAIQSNVVSLGQQNAALQRNSVEVARVEQIHREFARVLAENPKYQRALAAQTDAATNAARRQGSAVQGAQSSMDRYGTATQRAALNNSVFADTGRKSLSVYQRLRGELLSLAAAYVGLYQGIALVGDALRVAQQRAAINAQLLTANSGNARFAAQDQKFLREEAERLGLVYDDLAKKYANFAISAKAAGLGDKSTKEAFSQAADIVVGMRLAAEDADGVFRAFVQIMSKSRVQAEELRGQLGDRLPGAVAAFAKANNLALSDLDKFLEAGKGNVQTFLNFLEQYASTVQDSVKAGSSTLFADVNRLKTAYNDFLELVATSGTSDELQKAVRSLTEALKGRQGAEFAQQLADALTAVVKVLQFVIENFDTFLTLIKLFIGLQAAKAVVGLGTSMLDLGRSVVGTFQSMKAFYTATRTAQAAGTAMTGTMRALTIAMGPLGLALAATAGLIYGIQRAADAADARLNSFLDTMDAVGKAQSVAELDVADAGVNKALEESKKSLSELREIQENLSSANPLKYLEGQYDSFGKKLLSNSDLNQRISEEMTRQVSLSQALEISQRKRARLTEKEAAEDAERSRQEAEAARAAAAAAGKSGKTPKGPTDKQLLAAENSRANAARAIQKELLDLDQELYDARIDGEARTAEQIDENYALTIRKIESQIAEKQLQIDRLAQNANTANGGKGITAEDAEGLRLAREKIEALNLQLNRRAFEASQLQEITLAERKINELIGERDAKLAAINTQVELGLKTEVQGRREALAIQQEYSSSITESVDALIALLNALPPDVFARLGAAKLIAELEAAKLKAQEVKTEFELIGEKLGGEFAQGAASAFGVLAKGIAGYLQGLNSIGDAFQAASDAFLNFIADFLVGIGQAILQAIILKAIMNAITGGSGGYAEVAIGALTNHTGGIVGQDGKARWAPLSAFQNAQRFHDGGVPGLKANEIPTILERGEEVLTADDPRHVLNGGAAPSGGGNTTIINTIDSPSVVEAGLPTKAGTQTLVNTIKANRSQIRIALGI